MADFKIEVPIKVSEGKGGKVGEKIAEQVKKSLESIGIGKKGADSGGGMLGKGGLKTAGTLGAILAVLDSISFIVKPVMSLLKMILTLLFLPLIPIWVPTMKAIAKFLKWFAPVMKSVQGFVQKLVEKFGAISFLIPIVGIAKGFVFIIKKVVDFFQNFFQGATEIGVWIWEQIIKPGFMFLADVGMKIWNIIEMGLSSISDLGTKLWEFIKTLFDGVINVGEKVWNWFKGLFQGTINVATTVWNWFKGLFGGGGGRGRNVGDAIITPQGVVHTDPNDFIIATKDPGSLGGKSITININNPSVRQTSDIKIMANEVSRVLQRQMTGRISQ